MLKYLFISCVVLVFLACITHLLISSQKNKFFILVYKQAFSKQTLTTLSITKIQKITLLKVELFALSTGPIITTKLFNLLLIKWSIL